MYEDESKNRLDTSVPAPEAAQRLGEEEKKALELSELIEHSDGPKRERLNEQVQELDKQANDKA
jgi:hypothetical protein